MENYCSGQLSVPAGTKRKKGGADGEEVATLCAAFVLNNPILITHNNTFPFQLDPRLGLSSLHNSEPACCKVLIPQCVLCCSKKQTPLLLPAVPCTVIIGGLMFSVWLHFRILQFLPAYLQATSLDFFFFS